MAVEQGPEKLQLTSYEIDGLMKAKSAQAREQATQEEQAGRFTTVVTQHQRQVSFVNRIRGGAANLLGHLRAGSILGRGNQ